MKTCPHLAHSAIREPVPVRVPCGSSPAGIHVPQIWVADTATLAVRKGAGGAGPRGPGRRLPGEALRRRKARSPGHCSRGLGGRRLSRCPLALADTGPCVRGIAQLAAHLGLELGAASYVSLAFTARSGVSVITRYNASILKPCRQPLNYVLTPCSRPSSSQESPAPSHRQLPGSDPAQSHACGLGGQGR
jgi:hypothetical protein